MFLGILMVLGGWHMARASRRNMKKLNRFERLYPYGYGPRITGITVQEVRLSLRKELALEDVFTASSLKQTYPILNKIKS